MLFNTYTFLLFFPAVVLVYYLVGDKWKQLVLLLASFLFCGWLHPANGIVLSISILANYSIGLCFKKLKLAQRGYLLALGIIANVLLFFFFKFPAFHAAWAFIYPLGLSYYTLQGISYLTELYWENIEAERGLLSFSLYLAFFPKLIAGPVERPEAFLPQCSTPKIFDTVEITLGLRLILLGAFKKIVVADNLAAMCNNVLDHPAQEHGIRIMMAILFYAFQLYMDFSGYTAMAIGLARILGYKLSINFERPFHSHNISEFWRRWHISFSGWLREYLYTSFAILTRSWGKYGIMIAIWATFTISGLWHGSNPTFLVYGTLHGLALAWEMNSRNFRKKLSQRMPGILYNYLSRTLTFLYLCFCWVFFRASSVRDALTIFSNLFRNISADLNMLLHTHTDRLAYFSLDEPIGVLITAVLGTALVMAIEYRHKESELPLLLSKMPRWSRWSLYLLIAFVIMNYGGHKELKFIYFQF